jgi:hypothetical protein
MTTVYKRGRPPKNDGDRYKCGLRIAPPDLGTVEQRMRREVAAGARSQQSAAALVEALEKVDRLSQVASKEDRQSVRQLFESGVLTAAEYSAVREFNQSMPLQTGTEPVDILLARHIITRDEFEVALDFTACWCAYIGRPWPKGWQAERQAPDHDGGFSEAHLKRMKIRYWNALAAMNDVNPHIYLLVRDVVIHGKTSGLISNILSFDIVRQNIEGGGLITRTGGTIPPSLRHRITMLVKGLELIAATPRGDFTREADALLGRLRRQSDDERGLTNP